MAEQRPNNSEYVAVHSAGPLRDCVFLSWEAAAPHLAADLQNAKYKVVPTFPEAETFLRAQQGGNGNSSRKRKASPLAAAAAGLPLELDDEEAEDDPNGDDDDDSDDDDEMGTTNNNNTNSASASATAISTTALFGASKYRPTKKWEEGFDKLAALAVDGKLPESIEDPFLKRWVARQNADYNKLLREEQSSMSQYKIEKLRGIGFVFQQESSSSGNKRGAQQPSDFDAEYEFMVDKLRAFRDRHGDCRVLRSHKDYRDLFNWTLKVRNHYRKLSDPTSAKKGKCRLSVHQMQRLTEMGFDFRQKTTYRSWDERFADLLAYQAAGNDINKIPTTNHELGEFVGRNRKDYKHFTEGRKTAMTQDRIRQLEAVGFHWNVERHRDTATYAKPKTWDQRYAELKAFHDRTGHTLVPTKTADNGGLGQWVRAQRKAFKAFAGGQKSSLNPAKVAQLTAIGFIVDANDYHRRKRQRVVAPLPRHDDPADDADADASSEEEPRAEPIRRHHHHRRFLYNSHQNYQI